MKLSEKNDILFEKLESLERSFSALQEEVQAVVRKLSTQSRSSVDSVARVAQDVLELKEEFQRMKVKVESLPAYENGVNRYE